MTLPAWALTTVATVADELDLEIGDKKARARIERYIKAASSLIAIILGAGRARQLHAAEVVVDVAGMDHPTLILPHTPIVAVTSVVIADDEVDADEYEVEDAEAGFLFRVGGSWPSEMLAGDGVVTVGRLGTERKNVEVTYIAGWRTTNQAAAGDAEFAIALPDALEDACVQLVKAKWKARHRDPAVVSETFEKSSYVYGQAVPDVVMAALAPFIRIANA